MFLAILFWLVVAISLIFGFVGKDNPQLAVARPWIHFVLIVLLGIAVFGKPV